MALFGDIPLPKAIPDAAPGGRINQVYNALSKQSLENTKAAIENTYAPAMAQAHIAQLTSPLSLYGHDAGAASYNQLFNRGMIPQPQIALPSAPQNGISSLIQSGKNAINGITGLFTNGQQQVAPNGVNAPTTGPFSPPDQGNEPAGSGLGSYQTGANPSDDTSNMFNVQAQKANTAENVKNYNDQWKHQIDEDNYRAQMAQENINNLRAMKETYPKLKSYETGTILGNIPGYSDAAQSIDRLQKNIQNSIMNANQAGHKTDKDKEFYSGMKPARDLNPVAFNEQTDKALGMELRLQEKPAFNAAAKKAGLSTADATTAWNDYMNGKPYYDPKSGKMIGENLNSWKKFFGVGSKDGMPEKDETTLSNKASSAGNVNGDIGMLDLTKAKNGKIHMRTPPEPGYPNGKDWYVPKDKAPDAMKIGARQVE